MNEPWIEDVSREVGKVPSMIERHNDTAWLIRKDDVANQAVERIVNCAGKPVQNKQRARRRGRGRLRLQLSFMVICVGTQREARRGSTPCDALGLQPAHFLRTERVSLIRPQKGKFTVQI